MHTACGTARLSTHRTLTSPQKHCLPKPYFYLELHSDSRVKQVGRNIKFYIYMLLIQKGGVTQPGATCLW